MKRILITSGALAVVLAAAAAGFKVWNRPASEVRFNPQVGDSHQYRIGMRSSLASGKSVFDQSVTLQSVLRYRVTDRDGDRITLHLTPQYMAGRIGHRTLFDSTDIGDDRTDPTLGIVRDGFSLTMDDDGHIEISQPNNADQAELLKGRLGRQLDQWQQQFNAPGILTSLPAEIGASRTAGGFQTLPKVKLTVTDVDRDSIVVDIARAEGAESVSMDSGSGIGKITMTIDHLTGRMRVDRNTGWLESLAIILDQTGENRGRTVPIHTILSMQALDTPAAGSQRHSFGGFKSVVDLADDEEDDPGYPLSLPESDEDTTAIPSNSTSDGSKPALSSKNAMFKVDPDDQELTLEVPYDIKPHQATGELAITDLALADENGKTLELPMTLDDMMPAMVDDRLGKRLTFRPLGWGQADLSRIHQVKATFTRRGMGDRESTGIELTDHPTELRRGDARVRAIPRDDKANQWYIEIENGTAGFYLDVSQSYAGLEVRHTNHRNGAPISPVEDGLLARVDNELADHLQYTVKGKAGRLPLAYWRFKKDVDTQQITFEDQAKRYRDRNAPPPDTRHIYGMGDTPDEALTLTDVSTRDAERNRLRLRLPIGVGQACRIESKAPPQNDHALIWQPREPERYRSSRADGEAADAQTQDWELVTDDGFRRYFYNIQVATTLRCPGTPQWQETETADTNKPWLVNIADVVGHPVDPTTASATFFKRVRFLDDKGKALRPMPVDARPNDRLQTWRTESEQTTLADYLAADGTIRFWGRVAAVKRLAFAGEPLERHWQDELGGYE
ncbi:hypothetical protein [Salinisphaera sp. Q1T1-3]|uniref:hypothetical protein n=1 Tax=Salinisphaera sp. Q1T1-3 TaxID=2321229 RepID=UPI000E71B603|nr:hypothetical protein [Salinisphaera sp. Q1T1-3]RJS94825.1 hypothetical protein D3260_03405 [Salinisphaera sp. Q1T1-3]